MKNLTAFLIILISVGLISSCSTSGIEKKFSEHLSIPDHKAKIKKAELKRNLIYADSAILCWMEYKNLSKYSSTEKSLELLDRVNKYKDNPSAVIGEFWYVEYSLGELNSNGIFPVIKDKILSPIEAEYYEGLTRESKTLLVD